MGLLDGKVAIITGAGGGIGRAHALLFAREGAKVVVNDLGGGLQGGAGSQSMADGVVAEIQAAGGEAVASYGSVASYDDANALIQAAVDAFGRADVLVNNAGILRDKTLLKLEERDWDAVIAVHLKGTFLCGQAFARHVKERADKGDAGGRIINTSSYAGLKGNFGQTNYSAAKAGIYGLTLTWSQELARLGVNVNCLAPMAKTRMTEGIEVVTDDMRPEHVAPMALYLASDLAKDVNGRIFGIHGQQLLEYAMLMTDGVTKEGAALWTPQEIHAALDRIGARAPAAAPAAGAPLSDGQIIAVAFQTMPQVFRAERAKGWNAVLQFDITGGQPWTVTVANGTCTTQPGKHGEPTCVVTVDEATYAAVVTGKEKAEKAFMAGKIKATNLGDMMKMGSAFDMKQAAELAKEKLAAAPAAGAAAPKPAALTHAQIIAAAFQTMPQVYRPERAKGWNAVLQFDITGGTPWTITVQDGACTTREGKHGEPTCVVTVDEATYAAVVTGKEKAEKAFMAGKIKATNLGDMMKLGSAFDMQQAAELAKEKLAGGAAAGAAAAPAAPPPAGPETLVTRSFELLPQAFRADQAQGWNAVMRFEVDGAGTWSVAVKDGACQVSRGEQGEATCTVRTRLVDYAKIVSGELRAEQAFMKGRISATNLKDMMQFGRAFDLKGLKSQLEGVAATAPAGVDGAGSATRMNQKLIGKTYQAEPCWVRPEHVASFANATEDENPAYAGEGAIAPPMFSVRLLKDVLFRAMTDEALKADMLNLVHGEQDMEFLRPLQPWDLCATRATITAIEPKSTGELLRLEERLYTGGELAVRVRASMFIRDPGKKKPAGQAAPEPEAEPQRPELAFSETITVAADQSRRYAAASLDNNPIHTDPEVAKLAGFKGVILHGLCSMSLASRALMNKACGGDPRRLARLAARFNRPVFMGDALTTEAWTTESRAGLQVYGFRVVNQDGVEVIKDGIAEVRR